MTGLLIANIAHGLTGDAEGTRFSGAIRIRDGLIADMGNLRPEPGERVIDATGCVVTPGLVNTHHHLFQSVLKAVPEGMNAALDDWLMRVPYSYWPFIDAETLAVSARIGLAELVLSGATTVSDHHYIFSALYDYDPAEVLFDEAQRFGIRFLLARGGMTKGRAFDDPAVPPAPIETFDGFLTGIEQAADRWHDPSPLAMTRIASAPVTPCFNVEPQMLAEIAQHARARGLRLHAHLSENTGYAAYTERVHGKRPVPWLADHGWLGPDVWFAHLVDLTEGEVALLAETGAGMAHCPQANARLGSGIAPAEALFRLGGKVSMAVDGAGANEAADMGAALYSAFALHRATKGVGAVKAEALIHWATRGGAEVLGFDQTGLLAPGMAADIALFDLSHPRNFGLHDPALAPVLTGAAQVKHSFVGGRQIVEHGRIPGLDLAELAEDAARVTRRLSQKIREAGAEPLARTAHA
ncbi:amidohydrolase family protein [Pseudooceanicola sp. C21-150M6]|uniref:amidohydrolase family protein n=1 Tax=Pseudooceanicola sp. C21-150M6 TaxID=3434355 RepID=UPI003D7F77B2